MVLVMVWPTAPAPRLGHRRIWIEIWTRLGRLLPAIFDEKIRVELFGCRVSDAHKHDIHYKKKKKMMMIKER